MNANIMNTQLFYLFKYHLNGSQKIIKGNFFVYFNLKLRSYGQLFVLVFKYIEVVIAVGGCISLFGDI